jgi:hypothetical protein
MCSCYFVGHPGAIIPAPTSTSPAGISINTNCLIGMMKMGKWTAEMGSLTNFFLVLFRREL